jgi:hypothetical protein
MRTSPQTRRAVRTRPAVAPKTVPSARAHLTTAPFRPRPEQPHFNPTIRFPLRSFKGLTAPARSR